MSYVDGYVLPVPKKNMAAYRSMAKKASVIWRKYGALEYFECVGDDFKNPCGPPFPKAIKTKPGETVVFSFVVYRSKAQRDQVNAKVMKDPKLAAMMEGKKMPFDMKRMLFGGFKVMVEA